MCHVHVVQPLFIDSNMITEFTNMQKEKSVTFPHHEKCAVCAGKAHQSGFLGFFKPFLPV